MSLIREKFLALNKARLENTLEIMATRHRPLLSVLPLLFHVNDELLPGYQPISMPVGVYGFSPSGEQQKNAEKIWRPYRYKARPFYAFEIEAIFLMGSCGTIAFSNQSDFDVWICYRPEMNREQLQLLQTKADLIEKWYETQGLEVHFFLMNAEAFRKGRVSKLSTESSGSAQYHLLLDEFYRTSIWIAGKKPLWWEITPEEEKVYEKSKETLIEKGLIDISEHIDFGGLPEIPKSEFFGAAVWQIYKGIDSPYKSVLKITLMEAYAESYPEINPLSAFFKKRVYEGETDALALDAYLMLFNRIDNYLRRRSELSRLEIARRSFYLKLGLPLSNPHEPVNWRKKSIENLVFDDWGWSIEKVKHLDAQKNWMIEDVIGERKLLVSHLTNSYAFLSAFARKHATNRLIKPKDLTILGRKLYSAFDRKAGKVEIFNRGIAENMAEKNITVRQFFGKDSQEYWHIYRGKVISDQYRGVKPLRQSYSLIELLAGSHFNNLIDKLTQKLMYAPGSELGNSELNTLLEVVEKITGDDKVLIPSSKDLLKPAIIIRAAVFVNLGKQPKLVAVGTDQKIISGELDVLNYGGDSNCLIESVEHLYITSWKEVFVFKYAQADGVAEWLCSSLNMYKESLGQAGPELKVSSDVYSFGSNISHVISTRVNNLYKSVLKSLLGKQKENVIYIYQAAKQFYCLSYDNDHYDFNKFSSIEYLIEHLSLARDNFFNVIFDSHVKMSLPLDKIYKNNKAGKIQMFCYEENEFVHLFILDECGALFYQTLPLDDCRNVLLHYEQFFNSVLNRKNIDDDIDLDSGVLSMTIEDCLEMYKVTGAKLNFSVERVRYSARDTFDKFDIQVIGQQVNNKPVFTFYCDDVEYSSGEHGNKVFEQVAKHIIQRRSGNPDYYIYITDLELSPALLGKKSSHKVQPIELLKYKKRIELKLNQKYLR